jgi:hypothetical protein
VRNSLLFAAPGLRQANPAVLARHGALGPGTQAFLLAWVLGERMMKISGLFGDRRKELQTGEEACVKWVLRESQAYLKYF